MLSFAKAGQSIFSFKKKKGFFALLRMTDIAMLCAYGKQE